MDIASHSINARRVGLHLLSDLHLGATLCDEEAISRDLASCRERGDLLLINGDVFDGIVHTDPRYAGDTLAARYRTSEPLNAVLDRAYELLRPLRRRLVWLGEGNHETSHARRSGVSLLSLLAQRLGCSNRGYCGVFRLNLVKRDFSLFIHHGPRAKTRRGFTWVECDAVWTGHYHERGIGGTRVLRRDGTWFERLEISTGAYLGSYAVGHGDYAEHTGYTPGVGGSVRLVVGDTVSVKID